MVRPTRFLQLVLACLAPAASAQAPGAAGGPGLALRTSKALICAPDADARQVQDHAWITVKDGKIEAVTSVHDGGPPEGYEVLDVGSNWVMPGIVELHCHEGGTYDINDLVYLANPGLRANSAVINRNDRLLRGLAAGVTTVLFIPGSGANIGGAGVLFKTGPKRYEEALVREAGSLKLAQWGNPESWTIGVGMSFENWNTRNTFRRGLAYAKRWDDFEAGRGPEPRFDPQWQLFRRIATGEVPISTHTQVYQVVLMTITMIKIELGLNVFLDHSTIGGWLAGGLAQEYGVPAIVGPRSVDPATRGMIEWARNGHEGFRGVAAGYQEMGLEQIGFNTDSPVLPQEGLPLQAAMGVRYGFRDDRLQAVRGLTVVPAMTAGVADRIGSLTPGADADMIVISGHPADPRSHVELSFIDGERSYEPDVEGRIY